MPSSAKLLLLLLPCALSHIIKDDACKVLADNRICTWISTRWTYDPDVHECHMYYGCDTVGNVHETEEACYSKCQEKLIDLYPPQNVTAAYTHTKVYLYWYPPENFVLHEPDLTNVTIDDNTTYTSNNTTVTTNKPVKTTTVAPPNTTVAANTTSFNVTVKTTTNSSGTVDSNNTDSVNKTGNSTVVEPGKNSTATDKTDSGVVSTTAAPAETVTKIEDYVIAGTSLTIEDFYGKTRVPFHFARLLHYNITVRVKNGDFAFNLTVPGNETEKQIPNLKPAVAYDITVSAVYLTKSVISAKPLTVTMRQDPSKAQNCFCDEFGSKFGKKECNLSLTQVPWCNCKHGYAGLFCEVCAHGYYRTANSLPCHSCPCSTRSSSGSCHFVEGYLHCTTCKEEYAGNLCQRCANGYYRDHSVAPSRCIKCEGCHNVKPGIVCDQFTGNCLNCFYNTTGDHCEKCRDGFEGNPAENIPCKKIVVPGGYHPPAAGVIAACVIGTIVLLSGVVGFIVYKRMNNFPANRPFWTIEFKEDHDKVNFSAVPEDELERQHDDMAFYETQSKSRNKLPPYSQLHEEM